MYAVDPEPHSLDTLSSDEDLDSGDDDVFTSSISPRKRRPKQRKPTKAQDVVPIRFIDRRCTLTTDPVDNNKRDTFVMRHAFNSCPAGDAEDWLPEYNWDDTRNHGLRTGDWELPIGEAFEERERRRLLAATSPRKVKKPAAKSKASPKKAKKPVDRKRSRSISVSDEEEDEMQAEQPDNDRDSNDSSSEDEVEKRDVYVLVSFCVLSRR